MLVIKASTPEAVRDEIVKWLNQQASNHRIASCKMASVHKKEIELARATTYQVAADFLKNCTVEPNSQEQIAKAFSVAIMGDDVDWRQHMTNANRFIEALKKV